MVRFSGSCSAVFGIVLLHNVISVVQPVDEPAAQADLDQTCDGDSLVGAGDFDALFAAFARDNRAPATMAGLARAFRAAGSAGDADKCERWAAATAGEPAPPPHMPALFAAGECHVEAPVDAPRGARGGDDPVLPVFGDAPQLRRATR